MRRTHKHTYTSSSDVGSPMAPQYTNNFFAKVAEEAVIFPLIHNIYNNFYKTKSTERSVLCARASSHAKYVEDICAGCLWQGARPDVFGCINTRYHKDYPNSLTILLHEELFSKKMVRRALRIRKAIWMSYERKAARSPSHTFSLRRLAHDKEIQYFTEDYIKEWKENNDFQNIIAG